MRVVSTFNILTFTERTFSWLGQPRQTKWCRLHSQDF